MALFETGDLLKAVHTQAATALEAGALQPIPTHSESISDAGIEFQVRVCDRLAEKPRPQDSTEKPAKDGPQANPFLPYEPAMFVADVNRTHVCLLNKFNVVPHHLLIVTRQFQDQQQVLNPHDFAALGRCLGEYPALAFYNSGVTAGASQRHKHLQMIPLAHDKDVVSTPINPLIEQSSTNAHVSQVANLPFRHAFARLPANFDPASEAGFETMMETYLTLMSAFGFTAESIAPCHCKDPYNLLVTKQWMMLVPRSAEKVEQISINALGFAGLFFVWDDDQLGRLRDYGPANALRDVA